MPYYWTFTFRLLHELATSFSSIRVFNATFCKTWRFLRFTCPRARHSGPWRQVVIPLGDKLNPTIDPLIAGQLTDILYYVNPFIKMPALDS